MNAQKQKFALLGAAAALVLGLPLTLGFSAAGAPTSPAAADTPTQIVRIATPTKAVRNQVARLGLDIAGTVGVDSIDVILATKADRSALARAGLSGQVVVKDVAAAERERVEADKAYAAAKPGGSTLPSGRTTYRTLADYGTEMAALAAAHPTQTRLVALNHTSLEGRTVQAVEISNDVAASDGRPTFLLLGAHHAREWPSAEVAIEFAYDLLQNSATARIDNILDNIRVLIVPVVNPDGFQVSRSGAYELKRKNCRMTDGQLPAAGACALRANRALGVDLNRNYGAKWGGPGASPFLNDETYRGGGPFSEPETRNIQELISSRQVLTQISNHTYGALVLRPPGYSADGLAHDEALLKSLGDQMAAQMGYQSIYGWQLYDTTGTTEDWSYSVTGGLGVTFELGTNGFHPQFASVVPLYTGGTKKVPAGGVREAFLIGAESTLNTARHSVIEGTAPAGVTLRLTKTFPTSTWEGATFTDTLDSTMVVPASGTWTWHVNPSTRPAVAGAGGTEPWTLTCENPAGTVLEERQVVVARGAAATENLTC
ncbi:MULTISPECIES: M14 family metallopeptidase [unclassified Nocardioides]|uniref:M14 family metallopeptidase n=1 Tax=unclassified Nocardioides TaxID=2615069 RepID=UPI003623CE92